MYWNPSLLQNLCHNHLKNKIKPFKIQFKEPNYVNELESKIKQVKTTLGKFITLYQSYEIKSPPWTILWFRILGIFSVENIVRLCVFMFQT